MSAIFILANYRAVKNPPVLSDDKLMMSLDKNKPTLVYSE